MRPTVRQWNYGRPHTYADSVARWLPRHLLLEGRHEGVDVLLARIEGAHPAHVAGRLVPEVEAVLLHQALGDVVREAGEDAVGLHRVEDLDAVDGAGALGEALGHLVPVPGVAQPQ